MIQITLEKHTEAFIKELASKGGKPIYQLTPNEARDNLEKLQSQTIEKPTVEIESHKISGGPRGDVSFSIIRPQTPHQILPVTIYIHGAGWVMGSSSTHDHLVRELAVNSQSAVVFINYSRSPEARFPIAIEEIFLVTNYIAEHGSKFHLDASRLAVAGDSVGGNMAIALTMLAKTRNGPKIDYQVLFYPVTSCELNTSSYRQFAEGPWLTKHAMEYFWNAYEPDIHARKNNIISPLQSSVGQLQGLPSALIITAENDVLRDEGEQYAYKLMQAGVQVTATRFIGTIHDFVMLHALAKTPAAKGALMLAGLHLKGVFNKQKSKAKC